MSLMDMVGRNSSGLEFLSKSNIMNYIALSLTYLLVPSSPGCLSSTALLVLFGGSGRLAVGHSSSCITW
jgi:hypothetical protein